MVISREARHSNRCILGAIDERLDMDVLYERNFFTNSFNRYSANLGKHNGGLSHSFGLSARDHVGDVE